MGPGLYRFAGFTVGAMIMTEILYRIYRRRRKQSTPKDDTTDVIFFPDRKVACIEHFTNENGCGLTDCKFSHEKNSLSKLFVTLSQSKESMDVCVFVLTCADLTDILIKAHNRGVRVRVITDCEHVDATGSQVWRLRSKGIAVRTDETSYFMHHKFVIIDGAVLVNGSFNWTRQAITGNQENLLITNNTTLVQKYRQQFAYLWSLYQPRKSHLE